MSITSLVFFGFILLSLIAYYAVPKRAQWIVLLTASILFYLSVSGFRFAYLLITASTIYFAAGRIEHIGNETKSYIKSNDGLSREDKKAYKQSMKNRSKRIMVCTLIINFGILCVFKYCHFAIDQLNAILGIFNLSAIDNSFSWIVPLGISFYTFQATGYLIDVYWGNCKAQTNYFKMLLFVSFFPQVTQGPISDYNQLGTQFFEPHELDYKNYARGWQRIIWGLFKKMVVANMLAPYVSDVFSNYADYAGISVFIGAVCYSIQIYADFSGYMDIMCGVCRLFDIKLSENFIRPYFSKSIAEYWRRWHITLGEWFKKYIYYPIGLSRWNRNLGKICNLKFGKHIGNTIPASVALVVVWFSTGLWHGASWSYITWGGVNGLFIILSLWLEPIYEKTRNALKITDSNFYWRSFRVIRTFILVTFIKVLPEVGTLSEGLGLWKQIFTDFTLPVSFNDLLPFVTNKVDFIVIIFGSFLMLFASLLERKRKMGDWCNKFPIIIRFSVLICLVLLIFMFGVSSKGNGGFMYAQF